MEDVDASLKASSQSLGPRKDLWTLAKEAKEREKKAAGPSANIDRDDGYESTVVVVGNKQCGKTTLIHRLRSKDDVPTPTVALEYRFARSTRGTVKDIAHIWELAGGTHLSGLLDIPVTESNIHLVTFVIVLDLSHPAEAIRILEHFIERIDDRSRLIMLGLEQRGSKRPKGMKVFAYKKYGQDNPDLTRAVMNVLPVPLVIIGSKYDVFRDMEPEKKKLVARFLRFIAHTHGASLVFVSNKDDLSNAKARRLLNHHAFRSSPHQEFSFDYNKPLCISAGLDSLAQIGMPPSESGGQDNLGKQHQVAHYDSWKRDFDRYFPPASGPEEVDESELAFDKYPEPAIDSLRAQKDDELQKIRKLAEKKGISKEALAQMMGLSSKNGPSSKAYSRSRATLAGQ